ncbi:exonuclease domain-containing protein [Aeromicrobium wangtongii]|uniref:exonuclease domain-containing protein n=1 Tax=Aeromicrobium wangtongii TaxID=2969247 RepID=UPI002018072D|nr:exonuclease domain-containing protein [Aeromicrobium wangtongii]MCL3817518.1 exonuclease domain-containing protein [Aeromicrobium wangtongii]
MRTNKYAGLCADCGVIVAIAAGWLIGLPGAWRTICPGCQPKPPARADHPGWHEVPLASLDFETTGVDPLTDRVLSFALLDDRGHDYTGLIDPGVEIPPGSVAVHGLTAEPLRGAPAPAEALVEVIAWVQDLIDRGVGLVVFNAAYDLTMLRAEADRWGLGQPDWHRLLVVDPFVIDWGIERGALGPRRLTDVAAYYSVTLDNAHDAGADARAAREIAYEIGRRQPTIAAGTLDDLMGWQRYWFAERAEDWNRYAATAGRSLDDPQGWPLARTTVTTAQTA